MDGAVAGHDLFIENGVLARSETAHLATSFANEQYTAAEALATAEELLAEVLGPGDAGALADAWLAAQGLT